MMKAMFGSVTQEKKHRLVGFDGEKLSDDEFEDDRREDGWRCCGFHH